MKYIKHIIYLITLKCFPQLYFLIFRPHKNFLTIFLYHDIGDAPTEFATNCNLYVSTKTFKKQVKWISRNFNIIHPKDLLDVKKIPKYPAIITFDDGFSGAFENGISHLISRNIPSLIFLNMYCILTGKPTLAAIASYLGEKSPEFKEFAENNGLKKLYQLALNPHYYNLFVKESGEIDLSKVIEYQGTLANESMIKSFNNKDLVAYGNHLFDHWNSAVLTESEFTDSYEKNNELLAELTNSINMFAFPYGQPNTCFTSKHIDSLRRFGSDKVFYSSGSVNRDYSAFLLNRTALTESEDSKRKFWTKILQSLFIRD